MHPLVILVIGIVSVVSLIVVLRLNAFIALTVSALLVSLFAPGDIADKAERVAAAFGGAAGKIGIVIALAAIIGKCLMDSGAADRIVRAFLRTLGEKRVSLALLGTGYVLSIPVFFDTVFYLLVPLARSLWKRTRKDYVLYILCIGLGATITHTLVPPTPGPLLMAANLGVDLGLLIIAGLVVATPTAILGLLFARFMNRRLDIPVRPYAGGPDPEPLGDHELPGFLPSILPVILPVILISASTVAKVLADMEHAALFRKDGSDVAWAELETTVREAPSGAAAPAARLRELLPDGWPSGERVKDADALNVVLKGRDFYAAERFPGIRLPPEAKKLLAADLRRISVAELERFNRLVLEASFPAAVRPHVWDTPRRGVADLTALFGNANMALLLSAAIAIWVLVRNRRLSLVQLAKVSEDALMSAGVIILITAAGGAFGAMLAAADVGKVVEEIAGGGGGASGFAILFTSFLVSAVVKVAQGSSTVAMITASGMIGAMGVSPEVLGFHPVYLATAMGSGSLVVSWMNDSGFWVFTRMSSLTELEGMKLWSLGTGFAGTVGFLSTALAAWVFPLV